MQETIDGFQELSPFPQVAGPIDGSHIPIKAPKEHKRDYFGRKRYYSVLLQGVVDNDGKFIHASAGYPGSIHDSRMLRISSLYRDIERGTILKAPTRRINGTEIKPLLLGDPAYKLTTWLMKPYPQTAVITPCQRNFNKALSSLRVIVEQAFGLLKARWRCLLDTLLEDTHRVSTTIIACFVLHNMCIDFGDDTPIQPAEEEDDGPNPAQGHAVNGGEGRQMREFIRNYLDT